MSNAKNPREQNPFDRVLVFVSGPIQWLTVATLDGTNYLWHSYINLISVQKDNDNLRIENAKLKRELAVVKEQRLENIRLRALLGLRQKVPQLQMLYAKVVAVSPTPMFRSLRIDRGLKDGVKVGAAVVNYDGVIGRIAIANESWSDVILLVDANSSTDVLVRRTRVRARIRGNGDDSQLSINVEALARSADIEPGDTIVTSGVGTTFPKGLTIGTVMGVKRGAFGLYQSAQLKPSVDFSRIEEVLVITSNFSSNTTFEDDPEVSDSWGPLIDTPAKETNISAVGEGK